MPRTIHEALGHTEWKSVVYEEIRALQKQKTWEVVDAPKEKRQSYANGFS